MNKLYVIKDTESGEYYGTSGFWSKTPRVYSSLRNLTSSMLLSFPHRRYGKDRMDNLIIVEIDPSLNKEISYKEYYSEKKRISDIRYKQQQLQREKDSERIKVLEAEIYLLKNRR